MRRMRKICGALGLSMVLSCASITPCFAARSVQLTASQYWSNSKSAEGQKSHFSGTTSKTNPRKVYFIAEYEDKTGWHYNTKQLIGAGKQCPDTNSDKMSRRNWRLQLNPYGTGTAGCVANGTLKIGIY